MGALVFYFSIFLILFVITLALYSPSYKYPLLASILVRPVIDATWNYRFSDFNLIYFLNGAFVLIFLYRWLFRKEKLYEFQFARIFGAYLLILIFVSFNILIKSGYIIALEFFFKSSLMPISFYLFYQYFNDWKNGKLLSITIIMAGLFPLGIVLVQIVTGSVGRFRPSRGLTRIVGLYHDSVSTRTYFAITLIGLLLYWHYFLKKTDKLRRISLLFLFGLLIVGLYYQYSKTIVITLIVWAVLFLLYRKKVHTIALFFVAIFLINMIFNNKIFEDTQQVFSREIDLISGRSENTNILAGRILMWSSFMRYWEELPIIEKLIGPGIAEQGFHNDYIRMLFNGGVLFLGISILMMLFFLIKINLNYRKNRQFIHFVALLLFAYFFVESLGTTPGMYPNLQTIVWGIVGLSSNNKFQWQGTQDLGEHKNIIVG